MSAGRRLAGRAEPPTWQDVADFQSRMGFTQGELADALGFTPRALRYWRSGERPIPPVIGLVIDLVDALRLRAGLAPHTLASFRQLAKRSAGTVATPWYLHSSPSRAVEIVQ